MERKRELWIDYVKVFACILVVVGHFFQSMTKSGVIHGNAITGWFDSTIYCFHVALFFICSGYLYQKTIIVNSVDSWMRNAIKKLIILGIPYISFSIVTWLLKMVFSGAVNEQPTGLIETLIFQPTAPYWYLYCLFFLFIVTPTISRRKSAIVLVVLALMGKTLILTNNESSLYAVNTVLSNEIWFVAGMCLAMSNRWKQKVNLTLGGIVVGIFIAFSVLIYNKGITDGFVLTGLGCIACFGFIALFASVQGEIKWMDFVARYTMPIFLMHTIFAAFVRSLLLKIGIQNCLIHIILGLGIGFVGPILAAEIMKRFKWMDVFLYPGKYIELRW